MYPLTNKEIFGKSFISTYLLFLTNFQTIQISYLNLIKRDRGNSLLCEEQQIWKFKEKIDKICEMKKIKV